MKKTQETPTLSDEKYESLFEQASDAIMITDFEGNFHDVNKSLCQMFGYSKAELLTMNIDALIEPAELVERPIKFDRLKAGDHVFTERRMITKSGKVIDVEANVKKFGNNRALAIARDITEKKNAIHKLRESEKQLALFVKHSPAALAMFDKNMRYMITSDRWKADYGLTEMDITGLSHYALFPETSTKMKAVHARCLLGKSEKMEQDTALRANGQIDWVRWEIHPWYTANDVVGGILIFTEVITEKIHALQEKDKALYQLNKRIKELTTLYRCAQILQNREKTLQDAVKEIIDVLPNGWQYPEVCAVRICIGDDVQQSSEYRDMSFSQLAPFLTSQGVEGYVEIVYTQEKPKENEGPFLKEERHLVNMVADMLRQCVERKLKSEALQKSEANLQTILDSTNVAYVLLDKQCNVISYNREAVHFAATELNLPPKLGVHISQYFAENRKAFFDVALPKVLEGETFDYEVSYPQADGTDHWYHTRIVPITQKPGEILGVMIAFIDITEAKHMEIQREEMTSDLIQRNKDLEQFAYVVSHNLRAPVANIMGGSALLALEDLDTEDKARLLQGLSVSAQKLDEVIKDLTQILQVKREVTEKKESVDLQALLDDIEFSITHLVQKENVSIVSDFTEVENIVTLKSYLYSIFYNLITNSIKYRKPSEDPIITISAKKTETGIVLRFKDNGLRIDLERKGAQVFGLYKRFHPHIEGKGVGLFMVKTQVETLGGTVRLESQVDQGSEFIIEFPVS